MLHVLLCCRADISSQQAQPALQSYVPNMQVSWVAHAQVLHARWEPLLAIQGPPPLGRGLCPPGGPEYAAVVYHYARTLALAARAAGAASRVGGAPAAQAVVDADAQLAPLQARGPKAACVHGCVSRCDTAL